MSKGFLLAAGLLLVGLPLEPANAWFRGGGWGGMHEGAFGGHWGAVGGYGHWAAGGVTATGHAWGATGNGYGWHGASTSGVHAAGNYDGWAAVGANGHRATGSRYYGGAYGGAYVHSPAVVNGYYGGVGCYAAAAGVPPRRVRPSEPLRVRPSPVPPSELQQRAPIIRLALCTPPCRLVAPTVRTAESPITAATDPGSVHFTAPTGRITMSCPRRNHSIGPMTPWFKWTWRLAEIAARA
jgi:hypothetical protein